MSTLLLEFKSGLPEPKKLVIIKFKRSESKESDPAFEIGSAYWYDGKWWVNFYNPSHFTDYYEVLEWADYVW